MNQYDGSDDEEGQLISANGDNEIDSHEEGDTADSLDIKPPQARTENRYKEKKSSKDKKHSRERKHRERDRNREEHDDIKNRHRHRGTVQTNSIERERYQERFSGGGRKNEERRDAQPRYDQQQIRPEQRHQHPPADQREYYRNNPKDRDREKIVSGGHRERDRERRKESPDQTEADRILEDLRSRLLSKRSKIETDKNDDEYEHRRIEKDINRYEYENRGINRYKEGSKHHRENRKEMVEVIDSPENYAEIQQANHKQHQSHKESRHHRPVTMEDKEQAARRAKLIEAEREMAKRKEMAREELEARRELRRERKETSTSPEQTEERKKRRKSDDGEIKKKRKVAEDESVVMVSDNSDENDTASDSESTTNSEDDDEEDEEIEEEEEACVESKDEVSEGELPVSPISVGDLSKSERIQRNHSRSRSRSIRSITRSRSKTISRSVSPTSRNPSRSRSPRSRSRSVTPKGDENDKNKVVEASPEKIEEIVEVKEELPGYYPGIQGCRSVEEFQCLNRIEEGTYGVVYRAKDKRTEEIVALKRLKMEKEKEGFPITSLREINTLLKGQHPNIVTVREIVVGSNMDKIFIVMDYVEHDLKSLMETMKHKKQVFLPGEVKCLTQQLLRAVGHLHDNWILHRDLKTSNLLLSHKGILKVGDFGLAREYGSPLKAYTSIVVTLWYRAPELLLCCKEYSTPIDMWSVGCIFAEFLSMMALFPGKSEIDQLNRIFKDLGTPNERIWPGYNELPAVQKMTFTEYPVSQLRKKFSHYTSEIGLSLLQGLLTYDPKQRFTAEQALRSNFFKELPLPIDPAMFPTWPAKSELGARKALAASPKPPSGGGQFKQLENDDDEKGTAAWMREMSSGPGFSLKF